MKKLALLLLITVAWSACQENERQVYTEAPTLYFNLKDGVDSVAYSFTMVKTDRDTLYLPVTLLGRMASVDRSFRIAVDPSSTAEQGVHYQALESEYVLGANQTSIKVPVYILKKADLDSKIVSLKLVLVAGENFGVAFPDRSIMRYYITNQLVKPSYWDMPLSLYFGEYSKVKHQICIDLMGHDFPLTSAEMDYQYYMLMGRKAAMYFALHETTDENGQPIETWNPF